MAKLKDMTDKEFEAHVKAINTKHEEQMRFSAQIETAKYNSERHRFEIVLNNGLEFSFSPDLIQEVCDLSEEELADFEIDYRRTDLQWFEQGTGLNVLSVLQGRFGSRHWMEKLHSEQDIPLGEWPDSPKAKEDFARAMGSMSSTQKAISSRRNGQRGGRPVNYRKKLQKYRRMRRETISRLSAREIKNALINKSTGRQMIHDGDQIRFRINGVTVAVKSKGNRAKKQTKENTHAN